MNQNNIPLATIDFKLIEQNLSVIRSYTPEKFFAAVKGNAYGHGLAEVSRFLGEQSHLLHGLAVGRIDEALLIARYNIKNNILVMDGFVNVEELNLLLEHNFEFVINDFTQLQLLLDNHKKYRKKLWIQVDIGLNYLGFRLDDLTKIFDILHQYKFDLSFVILFLHLPVASNSKHPKTIEQMYTIDSIIKTYGVKCSFAASGCVFSHKKSSYYMSRIGSAIYGINPLHSQSEHYHQVNIQLKTAMSLRAPILSIRNIKKGESVGYGANWLARQNMRIAIVGIGYGDGYPREGADGAPVLINNYQTHIVGKISMDKLAVVIPYDNDKIYIGDWVTLWGPDLSINEIANHFKTSAAVLFTGLTSRIRYKYHY